MCAKSSKIVHLIDKNGYFCINNGKLHYNLMSQIYNLGHLDRGKQTKTLITTTLS